MWQPFCDRRVGLFVRETTQILRRSAEVEWQQLVRRCVVRVDAPYGAQANSGAVSDYHENSIRREEGQHRVPCNTAGIREHQVEEHCKPQAAGISDVL